MDEIPSESALPPRLLMVDTGGMAAASNTRLLAAGVAAAAGVWLFATGDGMIAAGFALAAVAFAMIWTMGWVRQRVESFQIDQRYLQLNDAGLTVSDGRMVTSVGWDEVDTVSVDEDRLEVCVGLKDAETLRLPDPYSGVTPHELAEIIHEFHVHADACGAPADA